jgi:tetratricopeptide (TPR) repeat protein
MPRTPLLNLSLKEVSGLTLRPLILLFALFLSAPALAQRDRDTYTGAGQTFEISGEVRVSETRASAQGIPVRLERFSGGIIDQISTDSRGRFRFANLQRGYYKVIVNAPGFRPAQQDADLQVLFRAFMVFELTADIAKSSIGALAVPDVIDARAPAEAREEFTRGRAALSKRNYQDAVEHLQKAILIYPEFFEARLLIATAFMDGRQWEKAEEALLRALEIKPEDSTVLFSLGEVYWRLKRYTEAEKALLDGTKLDDKSWHGNFTLARLYWDQGEVIKAGPAVGRTLQLKPDFAEAHLLAGNVLLRLAQRERALVEYREYLRLAPKGEFATQTRDLVQKLSKVVAEHKN